MDAKTKIEQNDMIIKELEITLKDGRIIWFTNYLVSTMTLEKEDSRLSYYPKMRKGTDLATTASFHQNSISDISLSDMK